MSDKFTRISVWKMDNLLTNLEAIIPLLKKDYSQEIDFYKNTNIFQEKRKRIHINGFRVAERIYK